MTNMIIERPELRRLFLQQAGLDRPQVLVVTADAYRKYTYATDRLWFVHHLGMLFAVMDDLTRPPHPWHIGFDVGRSA